MKKKVHIIFNEAGSGKSCYLKWLARQLQLMEEYRDCWISLESFNPKHLVLLRIFEKKFNNQKLIVMMDGFDEITPNYTGVVLKLLETLKNIAGVCKTYVASRPYGFRQKIEEKLGDCGFYRLKPFNLCTQSSMKVKLKSYYQINNTAKQSNT
ncbi:uncharacterized protein LOC131285471 [Anopheles ziemanni]|uniref:uncharacterized protein LOC131266666 n=1 Tax=Anopheles coustani TaxID=139045 RepID=UPI002658EA98|nr:uncharacterized protein LOC131266666 [Anopheles coustani]XP_058170311.1 uncharacterized protein LOC131285471 [Anopheles ziemanni]